MPGLSQIWESHGNLNWPGEIWKNQGNNIKEPRKPGKGKNIKLNFELCSQSHPRLQKYVEK